MTVTHPQNPPHSHAASPATPAGSRWHYLGLALLVLLGAIERWYGINRESLWSDELFAVMASYTPAFRDIWPLLTTDSHPPGYVSFIYWTLPWTGYSDAGIRLHALVFGVLWIPLVYWIGQRWLSPMAGLIAAALVASSQCAIFYSQEARVYSMLVVFCLINIACFMEILLTARAKRRYQAGFVISAIIALYLHYTGFVLLASQGLLYLTLWITRQRPCNFRELLWLFGIPLLTFSPWMTLLYSHMSDTSREWSVSAPPTWKDLNYTFQCLFGPDTTITRINRKNFPVWLYIISLTLAIAFTLYDCHRRKNPLLRNPSLILLLLGLIPIAAYYVYSHIGIPIFQYRYMLHALPLGALLCASLYDKLLWRSLPPHWRVIVLPIFFLALSTTLIWHNFKSELYSQKSRDPVRDAVQWIQQDVQNAAHQNNYTVVMTHDWFEHYLIQYQLHVDKTADRHILYVSHQLVALEEHLASHPEQKYLYYLGLQNPQTEAVIFGLKIRYRLLEKTGFTSRFGGIVVSKFSLYERPARVDVDAEDNQYEEGRLNNVAKWTVEKIHLQDPETFTLLMSRRMFKAYLRYNEAEYMATAGDNLYYAEHQIDEVMAHLKQHPRNRKIIYLAEHHSSDRARALLELQFPVVEAKTFNTFAGDVDVLIFDTTRSPSTINAHTRQTILSSPLNTVINTLAQDIRLAGKPYVVLMSHPFFEAYFNFNKLRADTQWNNRFFNLYPNELDAVKKYLARQKPGTSVYYITLQGPQTSQAVAALEGLLQVRCQRAFDLSPLGQVTIYAFHGHGPSLTRDPANIPACAP